MREEPWPELPTLAEWQDTLETVHLWSQIVGKIRLARMPWTNHSWHVPLYVTSRGLSTSPMPFEGRDLEIEFDFRSHRLRFDASDGGSREIPLRPVSVADFYHEVMAALAELDAPVEIRTMPVEIPDPVLRFPEDREHASYDPEAVEAYWRALLRMHRVFYDFRARFSGKVSPVHFFWGAFDLAVTRFSGRTAPKHPGGAPHCPDWVMQEAYSHEVSSAGFWPGTGLGEAAFYSYAYPEPKGFRDHPLGSDAGSYSEALGEFVLPYASVRAAKAPSRALLDFLQSTYEAAADHARWDRAALEASFPE